MKKNLHSILSIIAVVVTWGLSGCQGGQAPNSQLSKRQALFEQNCAICHGLKGDGKGEAAYLLQPKPRNFRAGQFRLVTSKNLEPTRQDILRVLEDGMPGTAMPSWGHLPEEERSELADYVLQLNRQGWVDKALSQGDSQADAEAYAKEMTAPGEPFEIPPEPPVTPEGLELGRKYYLRDCARCHSEDGKGKRDPTWRTAEGFPTWSRNIERGVFKGGREGKQLFLRFYTGLPGTPMPAGKLPPQEVWHVVHYIQSLSDPAAQERAQVRSAEIVVKQVQDLPSDASDAAWASAPEVRIALMPLWWHEGYIDAVRIKAVHDGQRLAFRLEWDDASRNVGGIRQQSFPDAAAIQFSAAESPPLFAMGAPGEVVNIWHWKALWSEDRKRFQDVDTAFPEMISDLYYGSKEGWNSGPYGDSEFITAVRANNPLASEQRSTTVENNLAAGLGTLTTQAADKQAVQGISQWVDGVWRLQMVRDVDSPGAENAPLRPGARVSVAFALWDGAAGDRDGQKSVSIWNILRLE